MDVIDRFWSGAQACGRGIDFKQLAASCGGWEALQAAGVPELVAAGVPKSRAERWLRACPTETHGVALTLADPRYPPRLAAIPGAPPVLCVEGELECLTAAEAVALVGTRQCTAYGRGVARHLGHVLAQAGVLVVSGLARGIDAHAHRAALAVGRTAAVLGHGLDHTAPALNRNLRRDIVDNGGVMISSWPDDTPPRPYTFPIRNQWIAGLVSCVVVVEAPARSGALITAQHALEVGRDVYAVPGPLGAPASAGCLSLLADGAGLVTSVEAFVAELTSWRSPAQESWLTDLFAGVTVEDVARRSGRSTAELIAELSSLELQGDVVRLPGQRYAPGRSL